MGAARDEDGARGDVGASPGTHVVLATFDGEGLRVAIEDWLAAGSSVASTSQKWSRSPEARLAEVAFHSAKRDLSVMPLDAASGRELAWDGWGDDVAYACTIDLHDVAPELVDGALARRSH